MFIGPTQMNILPETPCIEAPALKLPKRANEVRIEPVVLLIRINKSAVTVLPPLHTGVFAKKRFARIAK
jgi:hypothetical protein